MRASSYVLINVAAGKGRAVMDRLGKFPNVAGVEAIAGPYDLIVSVSGPDFNEIARMVVEKFQTIDGVEKTLTCNVINFEQ
jgi:DNA-binding Lrp family transcriptional regulator